MAVRLPNSENITIWGKTVVDMMVNHPELEQFPCKLKVEYNSFINDYIVLLLPES